MQIVIGKLTNFMTVLGEIEDINTFEYTDDCKFYNPRVLVSRPTSIETPGSKGVPGFEPLFPPKNDHIRGSLFIKISDNVHDELKQLYEKEGRTRVEAAVPARGRASSNNPNRPVPVGNTNPTLTRH
jgi:hypothetical protein